MPKRQPNLFSIMKKLFFCAAALLAAILFAACSDDDGTNLPNTPDMDDSNLSIKPDMIVGTWQITKSQWVEIYEGEKESGTEEYPEKDGFYWTFTFEKDGTGQYCEYETGETPDSVIDITYSISGNKFTLNYSSEDIDKYEIKKLTESQLVLFMSLKESNGDSYEETQTFKRIK